MSESLLQKTEKESLGKLNDFKNQCDELLSQSKDLLITDNSSYTVVKGLRTTIQRTISSIEEKRKEVKAPLLETAQNIDSLAKSLKQPLEERKSELIERIKSYEEKKAEEKRKKEQEERERQMALKNQIQEWYDDINTVVINAKEEKDLEEAITLYNTPMNPDWIEFETEYLQKRETLKAALKDKRENIRELIALQAEKRLREEKEQEERAVNVHYDQFQASLKSAKTKQEVEFIVADHGSRVFEEFKFPSTEELRLKRKEEFYEAVGEIEKHLEEQAELAELRAKQAARDKEDEEKRKVEQELQERKAKEDAEKEYREKICTDYKSLFGKKPSAKMSNEDIEQSLLEKNKALKQADNKAVRKVLSLLAYSVEKALGNYKEQVEVINDIPKEFEDVFESKKQEFYNICDSFVESLKALEPSDDEDSTEKDS